MYCPRGVCPVIIIWYWRRIQCYLTRHYTDKGRANIINDYSAAPARQVVTGRVCTANLCSRDDSPANKRDPDGAAAAPSKEYLKNQEQIWTQ